MTKLQNILSLTPYSTLQLKPYITAIDLLLPMQIYTLNLRYNTLNSPNLKQIRKGSEAAL